MAYFVDKCDVAVIGAGHAGIEAALAAARLGLHTVLFTINLDAVGNMPCNPAIGGTGKGHLVRELDALGGEMGLAADASCIQYRMLNRGKGPAVHSLRAQADRRRYQEYMKHTLEMQENLEIKQAQITEILTQNGAVTGVRTNLGAELLTLRSVRKEKGSTVSSPGCSSILEKSMLRRFTRGGVPVLNRRRESPSFRRLSDRPMLGCIPSGPEGMTLSPMMTVESR